MPTHPELFFLVFKLARAICTTKWGPSELSSRTGSLHILQRISVIDRGLNTPAKSVSFNTSINFTLQETHCAVCGWLQLVLSRASLDLPQRGVNGRRERISHTHVQPEC